MSSFRNDVFELAGAMGQFDDFRASFGRPAQIFESLQPSLRVTAAAARGLHLAYLLLKSFHPSSLDTEIGWVDRKRSVDEKLSQFLWRY